MVNLSWSFVSLDAGRYIIFVVGMINHELKSIDNYGEAHFKAHQLIYLIYYLKQCVNLYRNNQKTFLLITALCSALMHLFAHCLKLLICK